MVKKQRLIAYLYKENANFKVQQLFVDSFLVISALKGLSNLIAASKTEDEYGAVQQNLVEIITVFAELLKVRLILEM
jgi:nucleoporin NDC1